MNEDRLPSRNLISTETALELGADEPRAASHLEELPEARVSSPSREAWRRFRHNWAAIISLVVLTGLILMAIFAPFMHTSDPFNPDFTAIDQAPSWHHWFGTDATGRDTYSRLVYGMRVPLVVGILGTAVTVIIGTLLGVVAGYFGGVVDGFLSRFTDVMFAFPGFTLALIAVSVFGPYIDRVNVAGSGRIVLLTLVFAIVSWPALMRFVRSLALGMKENQFVEAARTSGTTQWGIMVHHLLPNMWGLILVQSAFIAVAVISNETVLSIFGLTVQEPNPDLGAMLYDGVQNIGSGYWSILFPGLALATLILAFTFVADGVRDAVDPRSSR